MRQRLHLLFKKAKRCVPRILLEESGQDLVEYSLLVLLIGTAVIASVDRFGDVLYYSFSKIAYWVGHAGRDFAH